MKIRTDFRRRPDGLNKVQRSVSAIAIGRRKRKLVRSASITERMKLLGDPLGWIAILVIAISLGLIAFVLLRVDGVKARRFSLDTSPSFRNLSIVRVFSFDGRLWFSKPSDVKQFKRAGALKLFELIKKSDLEGLVVKRKDGKYAQPTLWYKVLNPAYTQKNGRNEFFQRQ